MAGDGAAVAVAAQVAGFELVRRVFLGTTRGQLADTAALDATTIGRRHIEGLVDTVLGAVTVLSVAAALVAVGFIALADALTWAALRIVNPCRASRQRARPRTLG